ncbi:MAG: hypothetical protein WHV60_09695, partial [Bacteroidota bacterium]
MVFALALPLIDVWKQGRAVVFELNHGLENKFEKNLKFFYLPLAFLIFLFILQFDTLPIEMVWFGNISSLIPLTHCRSVFFDNQICYSVT